MNVGKKLRKFIFLNVFAMMGMSCYILADTFFISVANGTLGIAALNLTLPVYGLLFAIGSLIGIGSATRYSLCKMTDNETSRLYFSNAVMFAVLIGIGFTLLGNFFPAEILKLMGADADILSIGTEYLQIAMLFSPFFIANYTFTAFVRKIMHRISRWRQRYSAVCSILYLIMYLCSRCTWECVARHLQPACHRLSALVSA